MVPQCVDYISILIAKTISAVLDTSFNGSDVYYILNFQGNMKLIYKL